MEGSAVGLAGSAAAVAAAEVAAAASEGAGPVAAALRVDGNCDADGRWLVVKGSATNAKRLRPERGGGAAVKNEDNNDR